MENIYLSSELQDIVEEIEDFDFVVFQERCDNILSVLEEESPVFEALMPEGIELEVAEIEPEDRMELEQKMHFEIGKFVLSDMGGFNKLSDEEIGKIFQLEVEILMSLDKLIMEGHHDLFLIEDLTFLARMLRYSVFEDENQKAKCIEEYVSFFKEEGSNEGYTLEEIWERGVEYVTQMREERRALVKIEFEERYKYQLEVIMRRYSIEGELEGEEVGLELAVAGLENIYRELKNIYDNALGYNKVYAIPVRVLKNLMLTICKNFYGSNTSAIIYSNEYVALYTKE